MAVYLHSRHVRAVANVVRRNLHATQPFAAELPRESPVNPTAAALHRCPDRITGDDRELMADLSFG
jgi:hypothetical protein